MTAERGNPLRDGIGPDRAETEVHAEALRLLNAARIPYVVAGAYALRHHTGIGRYTKDLDLFLTRPLVPKALTLLGEHGYQTNVLARHWLANALKGGYVVDFIHGFGGWRAAVDDSWVRHSVPGVVQGVETRIAPVEEMTWMKIYVGHRERFDGADVLHLLKAAAGRFDWKRFIGLFDECWELLLSQLLLFQFVYPSERDAIPPWVFDTLLGRLQRQAKAEPPKEQVARGTLLDRFSYLPDIMAWGFQDGRVPFAVRQGYRPSDVARDREEALQMVVERRVNPARVA